MYHCGATLSDAASGGVPKNDTVPRNGNATVFFMRIVLILLVMIVFAGPARANSDDTAFRSGLSAFNSGHYARALMEWEPLAAAGDARAQESLGYMYYGGRGVRRDSRKAAAFFYRAAIQGEPTAQLFLAIMHFKADGVAYNAPLAMMWSELAMSGGQADAYELSDKIMQSMSEAQQAEGWRLIARWRQLFAAAKRKARSGMRK